MWQVGPHKTLQGNLDPCILYADDVTIRSEVEKMLKGVVFGSAGILHWPPALERKSVLCVGKTRMHMLALYAGVSQRVWDSDCVCVGCRIHVGINQGTFVQIAPGDWCVGGEWMPCDTLL